VVPVPWGGGQRVSDELVLLAHGDGGQLMAELIARVFVPRLGTGQPPGDDSARIAGTAGLTTKTRRHEVAGGKLLPNGQIARTTRIGGASNRPASVFVGGHPRLPAVALA